MRGNLQEGPPRHGKSHPTWKKTSSHCVVGSLPLSVFCSTLENMSSRGDRTLEGVVRKGEGLMTFISLLFLKECQQAQTCRGSPAESHSGPG